jgi:microcystin-dependent protein
MSEPYLGQLLLASWNYAPKGYAMCNGQLLAINSNQALFSLLGTTYGGNGLNTFALPNLQGRTPVSVGSGIVQGQVGGEETHTLIPTEVPLHTHAIQAAAGGANQTTVSGSLLAGGGTAIFTGPSSLTPLNGGVLTNFGNSQPHENRQPYLVMTWCIALQGIFPTRS